MLNIQKYDKQYYNSLIRFLEKCLPESGRHLDLNGRHKVYCSVEEYFEYFWCLFNEEELIGTVALKKLNDEHCELKSLYLLEQYQKKGLGYRLLHTAIEIAKNDGYKAIYLDTLSSSKKAIYLYEKAGFVSIERYNTNYMADVFMKLELD